MTYFILSLKWSPGNDAAVWWQENKCGYTTNILDAGHYTAQDLVDDPGLNDRQSTLAVPTKDALKASRVLRLAPLRSFWSPAEGEHIELGYGVVKGGP